MANIKSKVKNIKRIEKATARNKAIKSAVRTAIKKAKQAILAGEGNIATLVSNAHAEINRAVSKGVLHKKNGARKQARLDALVQRHAANK